MPRDVVMPVLGMSQETGVLVRWLGRAGERVERGAPLMEVETDKAVVEVDAPASGILDDVTIAEGASVAVGTVIARIYGEDEPRAGGRAGPRAAPAARPGPAPPRDGRGDRRAGGADERVAGAAVAGAAVASAAVAGAAAAVAPAGARTLASPKARRLARERGIDLATVVGSGPDGAVLATDLDGHAAKASGRRGGRAADEREAFGTTPRPTLAIDHIVDAAELHGILHRLGPVGTPAISLADVVVSVVAVALGDHAAVWAPGDGPVRLTVVGADGRRASETLPEGRERSPSAMATYRARLESAAGGTEPGPGADAPDDHGGVEILDLSGYPFGRRAVTDVRGPAVVTIGAVTSGSGVPVSLDLDPRQVRETDAVAFLRDVVAVLEHPSLLVLRWRG